MAHVPVCHLSTVCRRLPPVGSQETGKCRDSLSTMKSGALRESRKSVCILLKDLIHVHFLGVDPPPPCSCTTVGPVDGLVEVLTW